MLNELKTSQNKILKEFANTLANPYSKAVIFLEYCQSELELHEKNADSVLNAFKLSLLEIFDKDSKDFTDALAEEKYRLVLLKEQLSQRVKSANQVVEYLKGFNDELTEKVSELENEITKKWIESAPDLIREQIYYQEQKLNDHNQKS